jgi:hypothetical protein
MGEVPRLVNTSKRLSAVIAGIARSGLVAQR